MKISRKILIVLGLISCLSGWGQVNNLFSFQQDNDLVYAVKGDLIYDGVWLYGTSYSGGVSSKGAIYKIRPDGTGYGKLADFDGTNHGQGPKGKLVLVDNTLYGFTESGGSAGYGCIYRVNTDGTDFLKVLDFTGSANGKYPNSLLSIGAYLYGTATMGGSADKGTIYRINPDGTGFKLLHEFAGTADGEGVNEIILVDTLLCGTTNRGGANNNGTVFRIGKGGTGFKNLYDLSSAVSGSGPQARLVQVDTMLYGTTFGGGVNDGGTIFKISQNGKSFALVYSFTYGSYCTSGLTLYGSVLYGTTSHGGGFSYGNIYSINTNGTGYTNVKAFKLNSSGSPSEGCYLGGTLLLIGDELYGTTEQGGIEGKGRIFKIKTDGNSFTKIIDFSQYGNGKLTTSNILYQDGFFYGMTYGGGDFGYGTIFKIDTAGQNFRKILSFSGSANGANPQNGKLVLDGSYLYGMTRDGGTNNLGCIFKIDTSGSGYQKLFDFTGTADGSKPYGSLCIKGNLLYGLTSEGGVNNTGCLFKIGMDGNGFSKILDFGSGGNTPLGSLVISGDTLFGATTAGGSWGYGNLFRLQTDNNQYTSLMSFGNGIPKTELLVKDKLIYGFETSNTNTGGYIFKISTLGTAYSTHSFSFNPYGGAGALIIEGDWIYGNGFKIRKDFTQFGGYYNSGSKGSLISLNNRLYGMSVNKLFSVYKLPGAQTSELLATSVSATGATIHWKKGDGSGRAVFMRQGVFNKITSSLDNQNFYAVTDWNYPGTALDAWNCIYNGSGDSVVITNLLPAKTYTVVAFEYNGVYPSNIFITDTNHTNPVSFLTPKIVPYISWDNPADIYYGTTLNSQQLNASIWVSSTDQSSVSGSKFYDPPSGTLLAPGSNQLLKVHFTPGNSSMYDTVSKTVAINVIQLTPNVYWSNPADITYGTLLGNTQLNANADVAGTFEYNPAAGTKLEVGNGQVLTVTFIPNQMMYDTVVTTVTINVMPVTGITGQTNERLIVYPSPFSEFLSIGNCNEGEYLSIYNILGKKVFESTLNGSESITIGSDEFNPGLYLIVVSDKNRKVLNSIKVEKK